ncbi:hypothetical protein niasHT_019816 [Heterodera trifolii]|uniref:Secreted protein n=1 Tax=Heterodera trifolii TaxID=157864 RepID=A0ABD2KUT7_9BILA
MWFVLCAFVIPSVFCALLGLYLCICQTRMPLVRDESAHLLYAAKRQQPSPPPALMNFSLPRAPPVRRFCPIGMPPVVHCYPNWQLPSPILPPPAYSESPMMPMAFENPQFDNQTQQFINRRPTLCAIAMQNDF